MLCVPCDEQCISPWNFEQLALKVFTIALDQSVSSWMSLVGFCFVEWCSRMVYRVPTLICSYYLQGENLIFVSVPLLSIVLNFHLVLSRIDSFFCQQSNIFHLFSFISLVVALGDWLAAAILLYWTLKKYPFHALFVCLFNGCSCESCTSRVGPVWGVRVVSVIIMSLCRVLTMLLRAYHHLD